MDQAFVTLATNDSYVKGALVLGTSLRRYNTTKQLVALITPRVSDSMKKVLVKVYDEVKEMDVLDSGDSAHLALMQRPELGITLTKLHCWTLTQYSKCVFMDADTMVLSNIDELFQREELSAAPDPGWPDCFNSGVFVYRPSIDTYNRLLQFATENGSFDGGDQGLLNSFFSSWATTDINKHLPFVYNLSSVSTYSYLPAFKAFGANAKVIHFLGKIKPWNFSFDPKTKSVSGMHDPAVLHPEFLQLWWETFSTRILPLLTEHGVIKDASSGLKAEEIAEAVSQLSIAAPTISSEERKERWEQGQIDYMGEDSFENNIKRRLDSFLK
ncbi:glycogenin-1 [Microcaecilia unicolor]|uniref:glycogenin glucosyltransferase n=1 Tax=Microcaecilia unicolor TaxID=1415580 RepID=A0A6P7ZA28_9AMPH|nr:glycogenin-1 [Microcaecilia unicolor]